MMVLKALGASQKRLLKDKSVIFLFMHGGPSQFETFDPKMLFSEKMPGEKMPGMSGTRLRPVVVDFQRGWR